MKKLMAIFITSFLVFSGGFWYYWPDQYIHLVFCDVGQGDAILIWQGFSQVLIDSGRPDNQVLECLSRELPFWDRQLELAVATHADADHIGGFSAVMDSYGVKYILAEPIGKKTADFLEFHEAVSSKIKGGSRLFTPQLGQQFVFNQSLTLFTLSPQESKVAMGEKTETITENLLWDSALTNDQAIGNYNNRSIVLLARVGQIDVLLTGDLELEGEQALINKGLLQEIEVLKVGHHGSKTSTSESLLVTIRPEIAVVSSGKDNQYGHPAPEVIKKLEQNGAIILRTDEWGSVHLITNGETIWRK